MPKAVPIEDLFQQIDSAVAALESGDLPLEESLARYEAGLKALRAAQAQLDAFAGRLEVLQAEPGPT
jgi:exodeoxyribonuclease VII small subunit